MTKKSYDFVIGVGILNIFDFSNIEEYEALVKNIDNQINSNGLGGLWVTYDQSEKRELEGENIEKYLNIRDDIFASLGWNKRNDELTNHHLIGLDYNFNQNFGVFTKQ